MLLSLKNLLLMICLISSSSLAHCTSAIAIDQKTGGVLVKEKADEVLYPASLTKMMTAYIVFDHLKKKSLKWNQKLYVSESAASKAPSKLGLKPGEYVSLKDALLTMVMKSANDSATVLAEKIGGSEENFAKMMTKKARSFGMRNTRFRNCTGLHAIDHVSTASDMAILARRVINDFPEYTHIFGLKSFKYKDEWIHNTNKLLHSSPEIAGIKTGYTNYAGYNLASLAYRKGKRVITIVMHAPTSDERYEKSQELIDRAFANMRLQVSAPKLSHKYTNLNAHQSI
ncbi:D-alanyl-D-alanine carboxypeptidase family protein [Neorickettsia helminthoeca str. Oregon]|uniref:D-alanyl-D-alanine carboxypeptidase family protein n=1 Tax=Neorickettsia helminthoeca str. Oregon TaxID=1286528 RepID=X5H4V9_9RICK|nr:D-alanyl-D-alanine carboxypeptidase family protein [Neorickettsia helminthoeca]AHX11601.1 D-alanyl-D-alanine carboxypeptidase family protein [Neorickettsia helminthoeca str. Oregon]